MIGAILLAAALAVVPPSDGLTKKEAKKAKEEAKNLAIFAGHVAKFSQAKKLARKLTVVPGVPVSNTILAWATCTIADCKIGIAQERLRTFSNIRLKYLAAHEVCHVVDHDADGKIWHLLANEERDQRHRYVDACVMDLIGRNELANYLFDHGWNEFQIDRYIRHALWVTY